MNLSSLRGSLTSVRTRFRRLPGVVRATFEGVVLIVVAVGLALFIKTFFVQAFYVPSASMYPTLEGGYGSTDRILVEKPSYWFGGPERGDVVVFKDPGNWLNGAESAAPKGGLTGLMADIGLYPGGGHLVKRVIGVAGDHIICCDKSGHISINGHELPEDSFLPPVSGKGAAMPARACDGGESNANITQCHWSITVPPGTVFVMGDNRGNSADSVAHICSATDQAAADRGDAAAKATCALPFVPVDDIVGKVVAVLWPADRFTFLHRPAEFAQIP